MDWYQILSAAGLVVAMVASIVALARNGRKDTQEEAVANAEVRANPQHISTGIDDIRIEQRAMRHEVSDLATRVTRNEESTKSAHRRIDEHVRQEHVREGA